MSSIKVDVVNDLRESVTFRIIADAFSGNHTVDASSLVGNTATLAPQILSFHSIRSSFDGPMVIRDQNQAGTTSDLVFAVGVGSSNVSTSFPIYNEYASGSPIITFTFANTSGHAYVTFIKQSGFLDTGRFRKKVLKPNPYPNQ